MTPDEAELLARRIEEARATLLDPDARARYDEALRRPSELAARGGPNGAGAPGRLPPVIPALQRAPAPPPAREEPLRAEAPEEGEEGEEAEAEEEREEAEAPGGVEAREAVAHPAILLAAAVASAGPPEAAPAGPAAPPPARPILLQREVRPEPPPLPEAPPPAAEPPRPTPVPVFPDGAWTGEALRQVREARGLSISQIAERTKVTRHHIENIEGERFGALPAPVYLRGILLSLARELRLDGQKVARAYLDRAAAALAAKPR
jgi:curved DNA-binding protein CbpA